MPCYLMPKILGIVSIKGGVGKTTISAALASDLVSSYGKKVLLVDANYSAPNLGFHMDVVLPKRTIHHVLDNKSRIESVIHNKFGVDVIPGSYNYEKPINFLKLRDKLSRFKNNYDFVVIDSSPSMNEELLSTMIAADVLFVVTTPDYPTLSCSLKAAALARHRGKPIAGLILNKVRDSRYEIGFDEIEQSSEIPIVARLPDDLAVLRAVFMRMPVSVYHGGSSFSKEITRLNAALAKKREKQSFFEILFSSSKRREVVNRQLLKQGFYTKHFV